MCVRMMCSKSCAAVLGMGVEMGARELGFAPRGKYASVP